MSAFTMGLTAKGAALYAKAQTGIALHFTRIALGDGDLGTNQAINLNALISQKLSLSVTEIKILTGGKAVVGTVMQPTDVTVGFYWKELGLFASDPDDGEILYYYGNAGAASEWIPPNGGGTIVEKHINVTPIIGGAANITATIDQSLIFATLQNLADQKAIIDAHLADYANTIKSIMQNPDAVIGVELVDSTGWTSAGWTGDFATGFIHTVGQVSPLSRELPTTGTKTYKVEFTINSPTQSSDVTVSIGNSATFEIYTGSGNPITYKIAIQSVSDGNLVFTPGTNFDGTITGISVKEITISAIENNTKNTFIGESAGTNNITGYENVSLGIHALEQNVAGFWNEAIGNRALQYNKGGSRNVAIGYASLFSNISGQRNNAVGSFALQLNTVGIKNQALGSDTLFKNTSGSHNQAIGFSALYNNTIGNYNVAIGDGALYDNTEGDYNTGIGFGAGENVTTGDNNICIGKSAGDNIRTGSNNICIGDAYANVPTNSTSNYMNIGNLLFGDLSNKNAGVGSLDSALISITNLTGIHLQIGAPTKMGIADLGSTTSVNNTKVGALTFLNGDNSNVDSNTRRLIAYITGATVTTDSNADKDSGGEIQFFTKGEAGSLSEKMVISSIGYVGINRNTPTALLHIGYSSGFPQFKLASGAVLATPQAGCIEFDGTNLYFTTDAGVRKTIAVAA